MRHLVPEIYNFKVQCNFKIAKMKNIHLFTVIFLTCSFKMQAI